MNRAWFVPVLVICRGGDGGLQFWNVVLLPHGASDRLLAHELWHVKQDIATAGLGPFLRLLVPGYKFRCEAAAYGESVRHGGDAARYARIMAENYGLDVSERQCLDAIERCAERGSLFA